MAPSQEQRPCTTQLLDEILHVLQGKFRSNKSLHLHGEEDGSDTATADSGQSPPLTISPQLQASDLDFPPLQRHAGHHHLNHGASENHSSGDSTPNKLINSSAAAAFSQAVAAMQSLRSMQQARTSLLVNAAHPHSQLLATQAALLQNSTHPASVLLNGSLQKIAPNGGVVGAPGQDIDLTLPITSTYLRRMRALGLAAGFDQAYKNNNLEVRSKTLPYTRVITRCSLIQGGI